MKIIVSLPRSNNFDPRICEGSLATSSAGPLSWLAASFTCDSDTLRPTSMAAVAAAIESLADMLSSQAEGDSWTHFARPEANFAVLHNRLQMCTG